MNPQGWVPTGTVYGTLLNYRGEWAHWAARMNEKPYLAPPVAPVLYVKTANTFTPHGGAIALPAGEAVEVSASLGLLVGADGQPSHALLVNDVCVAHDSYHRPAVRHRCRDGFLGLPLEPTPLAWPGGLQALADLAIELRIHGVHRQTTHLRDLVRDLPTLWRDVAGFMSLQPGDVLLTGSEVLADGGRPRVEAGDVVEIVAPGLRPVLQRFDAEAVAA
ncbi:MAG: fumarylacetoacetate hydrolase family protein [Hydrogenophaga sp.]|jgi:5-oxopent-3-ene-1,2,5-tricarboxylate decarboxylase/2-hydroxyhepta-2,4-diene-1,7-dioate isomerase|nr:fumarylacetoacetate hydrolase family protein [Hydrogenophaga sp.]